MISFKVLTEQVKRDLLKEIRLDDPLADADLASDNLDMLLSNESDTEYAVSKALGCLLVRIFDGEYKFMYPLSLSGGAKPADAVMEIRAYAVKEEIPLVFSSVPSRSLGSLARKFRHLNIDAEDRRCRYYTVRIMNELSLLDEIPTVVGASGITLTPITPEDDADYTRLCADKDTNALWGYDYSRDEPEPDSSYFRESAEEEFCRSAALCLAVRHKGVFIGEAVLYYFDMLGGCDCAVRLLPEFRRKGHATRALRCLRALAKGMGLLTLGASVDIHNEASIRMTKKVLPEVSRDEKTVKFRCKL